MWIYITLKLCKENCDKCLALYLYEFTLLSNGSAQEDLGIKLYTSMNLHYSQTNRFRLYPLYGFIPLWIYITLKRKIGIDNHKNSFIPLWIYITLKHSQLFCRDRQSFIPLWIYIILKRNATIIMLLLSFIPLWIYITLKPIRYTERRIVCFIPLWIYITLKQTGLWIEFQTALYLYEFTLLSNAIRGVSNEI